ncbi:MAG: tetratricopeptide repeat protein [Treponema sp.]|jgi:tetratricopeptide (TPR) repeat protein|nr:tetratricopeptide repeat protein [Treponema sp.]
MIRSRLYIVCVVLFSFGFLWSCAGTPSVTPGSPREHAGSSLPEEREVEILPPAGKPPERLPLTDTQSILERMRELLELGDYQGALALFDRIENPDAGSAGIRLLKASVLLSAGDRPGSRALTEEIISADPQNTEALYMLSTLEFAEDKGKQQQALLEKILKIEPNNTDALVDLGNIFVRARSWRNAAGYFDKALQIQPENGRALLGRASVYRFNHDRNNAERLFNRAVELYPDWAEARHERARLLREWDNPREALEDLDKAKSLEPDSYFIAADRGNALRDLGRKREALEEYERAININPDIFVAYVYSSGIKFDLGDFDGADRDFSRLAALRPDYYFAYEGLGMVKMRKQLWAEARDAFRECYKYAPKEWYYALLAAMNWMRSGRPSDPRQFLAQALRGLQRESPEWYLLRLYHDLSGDNDIVVRIDREQNLDTKARMLFYLAHYYDIRGNKNLAGIYFLRVRELDRKAIPEWKLNEWAIEERNLDAR